MVAESLGSARRTLQEAQASVAQMAQTLHAKTLVPLEETIVPGEQVGSGPERGYRFTDVVFSPTLSRCRMGSACSVVARSMRPRHSFLAVYGLSMRPSSRTPPVLSARTDLSGMYLVPGDGGGPGGKTRAAPGGGGAGGAGPAGPAPDPTQQVRTANDQAAAEVRRRPRHHPSDEAPDLLVGTERPHHAQRGQQARFAADGLWLDHSDPAAADDLPRSTRPRRRRLPAA